MAIDARPWNLRESYLFDRTTIAEIQRAVQARQWAYAPYSQFAVGAALRSAAGQIWNGCNVENGSYGLTICAERVSVGTAVAAGVRQFTGIAVAATGPATPCGACRQVLAEFGLDLTGESVGPSTRLSWSLRQLLPEAFGPGNLS